MAFSAAPYIRRANYYETDKMGIVHHSNYIRWFEEARLDYLKQSGLNYEEMENGGILMPVTDVQCKYHYSIRFDEEVVVWTTPTFFNGLRAVFSYKIYTANGENLAATGESSHCFIDEHTRLPLNLKKRCPDLYETVIPVFADEQELKKVKE
ncbi:MAG: acyl-CoA thioesterase [Oscillospiraceae bacterium]